MIAELAKVGNELSLAVGKLRKDPRALGAARSMSAAALAALDACCAPMGLMLASPEQFAGRTLDRRRRVRGLSAGAIEAKVRERTEARAAKVSGARMR